MFSHIISLSASTELTNPPFQCMLKINCRITKRTNNNFFYYLPNLLTQTLGGLYVNRDVWAACHLCATLLAKYPLLTTSIHTARVSGHLDILYAFLIPSLACGLWVRHHNVCTSISFTIRNTGNNNICLLK